MSEQVLSIGQIVHYVLSANDAEAINRRRVPKAGHGDQWPGGAQAHVGNSANAGDIVPTIVVWPHFNPDQTFNGQAILDGNDSLWITSARYDGGGSQGTWHWPGELAQKMV